MHPWRNQLGRLGPRSVFPVRLAWGDDLGGLRRVAERAVGVLLLALTRPNHLGRLRRVTERNILLLVWTARGTLGRLLSTVPGLIRWLRSAHVGLDPLDDGVNYSLAAHASG